MNEYKGKMFLKVYCPDCGAVLRWMEAEPGDRVLARPEKHKCSSRNIASRRKS